MGVTTYVVGGTILLFVTKAVDIMPSMKSTLALTPQNAKELARAFREVPAEPATVPYSLAAAVILGAAITLAAVAAVAAVAADRR